MEKDKPVSGLTKAEEHLVCAPLYIVGVFMILPLSVLYWIWFL